MSADRFAMPDRVALRGDLAGVAGEVDHGGVGDGGDPASVGEHLIEVDRVRRSGRAQIDGPSTTLGTAPHVDADVGRDAIEPGLDT